MFQKFKNPIDMINLKKLLITVTLVFSTVTLFAQKSFEDDNNVISLTVGYGNTLHTGSEWKTKFPVTMLFFEACVKDYLFDSKSSLGIGGFVGYSSQKYDTKSSNIKYLNMKYTDVVVGARGNIHYSFLPKLDTYLGISLGYDFVNADGRTAGDYDDLDSNKIIFGAHIGARYYILPKIAIMAETGYNVSYVSGGVSVKF